MWPRAWCQLGRIKTRWSCVVRYLIAGNLWNSVRLSSKGCSEPSLSSSSQLLLYSCLSELPWIVLDITTPARLIKIIGAFKMLWTNLPPRFRWKFSGPKIAGRRLCSIGPEFNASSGGEADRGWRSSRWAFQLHPPSRVLCFWANWWLRWRISGIVQRDWTVSGRWPQSAKFLFFYIIRRQRRWSRGTCR